MVGKLGNHLSDLAKTSLSPSEGSLRGVVVTSQDWGCLSDK